MFNKEFLGKDVKFTIKSKNAKETKTVVCGSFQCMMEYLPLFDMASDLDFLIENYIQYMDHHGFQVEYKKIRCDDNEEAEASEYRKNLFVKTTEKS